MSGYRNKSNQSQLTAPSFVYAAGAFTTEGGDAVESIAITGATSSDVAIVTLKSVGGTPRTIITAISTTNAITVTLSGNPSTDHVLSYLLLRSS